MRLLVLLREARDLLNADLQRFFGVCLTDMYEGRVGVGDVSDFAARLPRGGAVAEWLGGWGAITAEDEAMRRIEHLLHAQIIQASGKKHKLPAPTPPKSLRDGAQVVRKNRATRDRVKRFAEQGWRQ